ncbi:hypothetical protein K0O13_01580 [Mammaliicoccus sciuri]|uniref:hypothetical protein n=1 Tax=Mammaliicoccus sciuri TaxID=1296 RepID=UPI00195454C2|nr:hypothetical protein [Mammaliicoccus sciuri]QYG31621.1 hypothetical protein K0O13_01580 [Mammaliicoccus sciuri]
MTHSYSDYEMEIIQKSLEKLTSEGKRLCSCDFALLEPEKFKVLLPLADGNIPINGPIMVLVTCKNCCKTHLFSSKMLGVG